MPCLPAAFIAAALASRHDGFKMPFGTTLLIAEEGFCGEHCCATGGVVQAFVGECGRGSSDADMDEIRGRDPRGVFPAAAGCRLLLLLLPNLFQIDRRAVSF